MLSYLADYENFFGPLRVFRSQTFRTVGAAVTAAMSAASTSDLSALWE